MSPGDSDGTLRQKMIELLKVRPWDAGGLSRALGITQRMVEAHLRHVAQSVEAQGLKFVISPSQCRDCEFTFSDRSRTTKPSRCPKCRSEQIAPPAFEARPRSARSGYSIPQGKD